ncbi:hypothetical protein Sjap_024400 [Stephania japonica]|uniref:Uncharacterized protein n=1 Tax=Stephania japonica TaxID=461633 RepID=A0AAP0EKJ8_9MAGN
MAVTGDECGMFEHLSPAADSAAEFDRCFGCQRRSGGSGVTFDGPPAPPHPRKMEKNNNNTRREPMLSDALFCWMLAAAPPLCATIANRRDLRYVGNTFTNLRRSKFPGQAAPLLTPVGAGEWLGTSITSCARSPNLQRVYTSSNEEKKLEVFKLHFEAVHSTSKPALLRHSKEYYNLSNTDFSSHLLGVEERNSSESSQRKSSIISPFPMLVSARSALTTKVKFRTMKYFCLLTEYTGDESDEEVLQDSHSGVFVGKFSLKGEFEDEEEHVNFDNVPKFDISDEDFIEDIVVFGDDGFVIKIILQSTSPRVIETMVNDVVVENYNLEKLQRQKEGEFEDEEEQVNFDEAPKFDVSNEDFIEDTVVLRDDDFVIKVTLSSTST